MKFTSIATLSASILLSTFTSALPVPSTTAESAPNMNLNEIESTNSQAQIQTRAAGKSKTPPCNLVRAHVLGWCSLENGQYYEMSPDGKVDKTKFKYIDWGYEPCTYIKAGYGTCSLETGYYYKVVNGKLDKTQFVKYDE